ncbi:MAG: cytochrome c family protein [Planctomycetota bacterium]|nr:cytochrome c family protein [Planctomycetota bacterium]MDA1222301.1 cytochrome c family protein [Planctomycetota bacterium]
MNPFSALFVGAGLLVLPVLSSNTETGPQGIHVRPVDGMDSRGLDGNRYVGQKVCKNCHSKPEKGEVHEKWSAGPHAKAFDVLASEAAKKIAKDMGIEDPQKSDQCLECHVTAFGVDKDLIKRGFKPSDGVQCETCHGPGEEHFKIRFKESQGGESTPVSAEEILNERDVATCTKCHNERSPTYKEFCFKERMAAIEHFDPRKERTEEELKKLRETCSPDCKKCAKEKEEEGKKGGD